MTWEGSSSELGSSKMVGGRRRDEGYGLRGWYAKNDELM
jgi:hypothetical protein